MPERTPDEYRGRREGIRDYLDQRELYPSESRGTQIAIRDMEPRHAYRAYRALRLVFFPEWPTVKHADLVAALIERAMEGDVALKRKGESTGSSLALEDVFDALQKLDDTSNVGSKPLHPITRARIVHDHLTKETHA